MAPAATSMPAVYPWKGMQLSIGMPDIDGRRRAALGRGAGRDRAAAGGVCPNPVDLMR
eukprot:SAG31_NODE_4776_length_2961_cov_5.154437_5_plen_58_part_00